MYIRTIATSLFLPTLAALALACGPARPNSNAPSSLDDIGQQLAAPAHHNMSPTVDGGGPSDEDLAQPARHNTSPAPHGP